VVGVGIELESRELRAESRDLDQGPSTTDH
jgi:hypothetical protein